MAEATQEPIWSRTTSWRQGSVIPKTKAVSLGLINGDETEGLYAVIISHDCDIANEELQNEPDIEIIIGKILNEEEKDGVFFNSKNPRKLHLEYLVDSQASFIELIASSKKVISKKDLSIHVEPDPKFNLESKGKKILQSWLACRYKRHALPNILVDRLEKNNLSTKLNKTLKNSDKSIVGIYVSYDPKNEILVESEPYELWLTVVYAVDSLEFEQVAETIVKKLTALFTNTYKSSGKWELIELASCTAVAETGFTVRDLRETEEYRFEHISFRGDESGPMLAP